MLLYKAYLEIIAVHCAAGGDYFQVCFKLYLGLWSERIQKSP